MFRWASRMRKESQKGRGTLTFDGIVQENSAIEGHVSKFRSKEVGIQFEENIPINFLLCSDMQTVRKRHRIPIQARLRTCESITYVLFKSLALQPYNNIFNRPFFGIFYSFLLSLVDVVVDLHGNMNIM